MGDLSTNFSRREFECHCGCGFNTVDAQLLQILQWLRNSIEVPVTITSGARCKEHNTKVGAKNSQHLIGRAADIQVEGKTSKEIYDYVILNYCKIPGLILYENWVHLDTRNNGYRSIKTDAYST